MSHDPVFHDEEVFETAKVERTLYTDGYREGIVRGKSDWVQQGFDASYSSGARVGARVGRLCGILQARGDDETLMLLRGELTKTNVFHNGDFVHEEVLAKWEERVFQR